MCVATGARASDQAAGGEQEFITCLSLQVPFIYYRYFFCFFISVSLFCCYFTSIYSGRQKFCTLPPKNMFVFFKFEYLGH
jgi:hypothetical protein